MKKFAGFKDRINGTRPNDSDHWDGQDLKTGFHVPKLNVSIKEPVYPAGVRGEKSSNQCEVKAYAQFLAERINSEMFNLFFLKNDSDRIIGYKLEFHDKTYILLAGKNSYSRISIDEYKTGKPNERILRSFISQHTKDINRIGIRDMADRVRFYEHAPRPLAFGIDSIKRYGKYVFAAWKNRNINLVKSAS